MRTTFRIGFGVALPATLLCLVAHAAPAVSPTVALENARASGSLIAFADAAANAAKAAAEGDVTAGYALALAADDGDIVANAYVRPEARARYLAAGRAAAEKAVMNRGDSESMYLLAYDRKNTNLLHQAANAGYVPALNLWATFLLAHPEGRDAAYRYILQAANGGDINGICNLGVCYARGLGTERDDAKALDCFNRAAAAGHSEAMNNLGWFYGEGRGVSNDLVRAAEWFGKSARLRNMSGEFNYGLAFLGGAGVAQDPVRAERYLKRSADAGCLEAMDSYGVALWRGDIIAGNPEKAFEYFMRAAQKRYPPAMDHLASCYDTGKGAPEDSKKALTWKLRARAARGDKVAAEWLSREEGDAASATNGAWNVERFRKVQ